MGEGGLKLNKKKYKNFFFEGEDNKVWRVGGSKKNKIWVGQTNSEKLKNAKNHQRNKKKIKKIVSLHVNISITPFDQRSPGPPEEGVLNCHTQTDEHGNSMTELAQWGQCSESH